MNLEKFQGQSVFISESSELIEVMKHTCLDNLKVIYFENEVIPKNLTEYLQENQIQLAIVHPAVLADEQSILEAHKAGFWIISIENPAPASREQIVMYRKLRKSGIPHCVKGTEEFIPKLLNCLSSFVEK